MNKKLLIEIVIIMLILIALSITSSLLKKETNITNFEECVNAGNPVMESYPRQCKAEDETFIEEIKYTKIFCQPEQRNAEFCPAIYQPVCGKVNIQCITTPCNPVFETFSNSCTACKNPLVEYYTEGKC